MPITVDSGAIDSVIPTRVASAVPVRETEASRRGLKYRAAHGTSITNKGERKLRGYTNDANMVDMSMHTSAVKGQPSVEALNIPLSIAVMYRNLHVVGACGDCSTRKL